MKGTPHDRRTLQALIQIGVVVPDLPSASADNRSSVSRWLGIETSIWPKATYLPLSLVSWAGDVASVRKN